MFKKTLMILIAVSALAACSGKKGEVQKPTMTSAVAVYDSAKATELSGQDKFVKHISLKLKVGETYSYKFTKLTKQTNDSIEMTNEMTQFYTKRVKAIRSDGSMEISFVFDSIRVAQNVKSPTQSQPPVAYNSNDSANRKDEKFKDLNSIVNEEFSLIIDKEGDVIEILGVMPVVNKILGAKKDSVNPETKVQLAQSIRTEVYQIFKEESISFTETDLDNSQSWQSTDKMQLNEVLGVIAKTDFKITSVKSCNNNKFAEIEISKNGQFILDPKAKGKVTFTTTSLTSSGKCLTNVETGATIKKTTALKMRVDGESQGHKFATSTTTDSIIELLK